MEELLDIASNETLGASADAHRVREILQELEGTGALVEGGRRVIFDLVLTVCHLSLTLSLSLTHTHCLSLTITFLVSFFLLSLTITLFLPPCLLFVAVCFTWNQHCVCERRTVTTDESAQCHRREQRDPQDSTRCLSAVS